MDIVQFFMGLAPDDRGRTIASIWAYDLDRLEREHDFIQELFPLPEPSAFVADAPILTPPIMERFQHNAGLRGGLLKSLDVMLAFYGFRRDAAGVHRGPNHARRIAQWARPGNHNLRRISRILRCLRLCGLTTEAEQFLYALPKPGDTDPPDVYIDAITYGYWCVAARARTPFRIQT